jgi:hypothetical protein
VTFDLLAADLDLADFLAGFDQTPGRVVHTLHDGQPVRCERTETGWDLEPEGWTNR